MAKKNKKEELELDVKSKKTKSKAKDSGGKSKKGKGFTEVDFSEEVEHEGGGGRWLKRVAEGDYVFKVKSISEARGKNPPHNKMLVFIFEGDAGKVKGQQLRDRFVLVPNSLFKLRHLLEAMGQEVPKRGVRITHKNLIGERVGITLRDGDEYEGKIRSEAGDYLPAEDVEIQSDVAEAKGKKGKKGKGKKGKKDSLEDLDLENI